MSEDCVSRIESSQATLMRQRAVRFHLRNSEGKRLDRLPYGGAEHGKEEKDI